MIRQQIEKNLFYDQTTKSSKNTSLRNNNSLLISTPSPTSTKTRISGKWRNIIEDFKIDFVIQLLKVGHIL